MAAGTLTLRTRTQSGATTKGSRLTHEELDDNFLFLQSGSGAVSRTMQAPMRAITRTGDYDTAANFTTATEALTETVGVARLNIQQNDGIRYNTSTGYGPFVSHTLQSTFSGTVDNVLMFASYNISEGTAGTKIVSAEPTLAFQMEADYNNGSAHLMEMVLDYTSASGGVSGRRFLGFNVDRTTDLGEWTFWCNTMTFVDSTNAHQWFAAAVTASAATLTLSANTRLGIGTTPATSRSFEIAGTLSGTQQFSEIVSTTFSSGATVAGTGYITGLATAAAAFTCGEVNHYTAQDVVVGSGSTVTNQYGFRCLDFTGGTNNYGYFGQVAAGANKYNLYMTGTAQNYLAGITGIGIAPSATAALALAASTTGVSSLRVPHGAAPTSPVNGDIWTTTAGLFVQINGAPVGPLS